MLLRLPIRLWCVQALTGESGHTDTDGCGDQEDPLNNFGRSAEEVICEEGLFFSV